MLREYEFTYIAINIASRLFTGFEERFRNRFLRRYWIDAQEPIWGLLFGVFIALFFILLGTYKAPKKELI